MKPLFCSFYSGPGYAEEAQGLVESLEAFRLDYEVNELPDAGSWAWNCGRKAAYLLTCRAKHPGRPLVWVDADARIVQRPTWFDTLDCDIAYHLRHGEELLSGTLYFGATDGASDLLERWQVECQYHPDEWDQRVLDRVLKENPDRWREDVLPASYVSIFDAPEMNREPAVIRHRQASRRLKR